MLLCDDGIGPNCDIVQAKKEDLACAWVKVKNINVVIKRYRMSSLHMHQLGKSMVELNT